MGDAFLVHYRLGPPALRLPSLDRIIMGEDPDPRLELGFELGLEEEVGFGKEIEGGRLKVEPQSWDESGWTLSGL